MESKGLYYTLLYVGVLIVFYYLFILIPGKKRKRAHDEMQQCVKSGDRVVTIGGVKGTVVEAGEETLVIETGGSRIEILRGAVQMVCK
ncbi:MAG: preprotein translocase subunit YajC [Pyramidobacter porci]|uniref:preprotein translocase subunit YajC n=1 Tax=Pyramidobacter porci TaxID=2605789 RepID=UPI002A760C98|nr:preprotein translocase subunit YajC [Pyramidobacter porci]MDY2649432.1 preprotein translocase subunit YajC [Pyramidobacter porci]